MAVAVKTKAKPLGTVRAPSPDLGSNLVLVGEKGARVVLTPHQVDATLEETIEGASTLTIAVHDYRRTLLRSQILRTAATLTLDNVTYRLVKVAYQANTVTLTLEELAANLLRGMTGPKKANRTNTTRAQFVESLVREVTGYVIPFQCPEKKIRQPIASK